MKPLVIDLYAGLGGWAEGFLADGWQVIGFDIERHAYSVKCKECDGTGNFYRNDEDGDFLECDCYQDFENYGKVTAKYPGELVLQDVLTLHGSQFRDAACIVASPPCQEFSYMAMPWSRAKQISAALREDISPEGLMVPFPDGYTGSRTIADLTALFDACFRIQREACEAAGRYIPMVVENVKGAQPWVGRAKANYGSFYLWGDVGMVGNRVVCRPEFGHGTQPTRRRSGKKNEGVGSGGSWFPISHGQDNGQTYGAIPNRGENIGEGRKVPGMNFHEHEKTGKPGRSFQSAAVEINETRIGRDDGTKQGGNWWHDPKSITRKHSSRSPARKAASAQIAKIPFELAAYVARSFRPQHQKAVGA